MIFHISGVIPLHSLIESPGKPLAIFFEVGLGTVVIGLLSGRILSTINFTYTFLAFERKAVQYDIDSS